MSKFNEEALSQIYASVRDWLENGGGVDISDLTSEEYMAMLMEEFSDDMFTNDEPEEYDPAFVAKIKEAEAAPPIGPMTIEEFHDYLDKIASKGGPSE